MPNPIIFFGSEAFSALSLEALINASYPIVAVVTKPDSKRGRGKKMTPPAVKLIAEANDIPIIQPTSDEELFSALEALMAEQSITGVLVSYGRIISQRIIDLFSPGIVNVHPSLLPRYRGSSPIEAAIVNGDRETGVTLMQLVKKMDAGPIYAFSPLELTGTETQETLYETLGILGSQMLVATLPDIITGSITGKPQDDLQATYTALLTKTDGLLDPSVQSSFDIERRVRAYGRYPKTKLTAQGVIVQPLAAHTAQVASVDSISLRCADDHYVIIDELIGPNGKRMSGEAFMRGYRE